LIRNKYGGPDPSGHHDYDEWLDAPLACDRSNWDLFNAAFNGESLIFDH
jgi:hypothetical protein